jgi:hypothetical protein
LEGPLLGTFDLSAKTMNNTHPLSHEDRDGATRYERWEQVAQTSGLTIAEIMVGRLQAEGIPARAWQEGAGLALGLTVGLLGMGHVEVPAEFAEQARAILAEGEALEFDEEEE